MPKIADAAVIIHGIFVSLEDLRDFETKALTGKRRATILGANGGAAVVNFDATQPTPFAPLMSQVIWEVVNAPWAMEGGSGMSTKFVREVDTAHLIALSNVLDENAARYSEKAK